MAAALTRAAPRHAASTRCNPSRQRAFSDAGHLRFYGRALEAAPRRPRLAPGVATHAAAQPPTSAPDSSRRARVLQQIADVEATLHALDQAAPLAPLPRQYVRRSRASSSSSSESSSSSSSESEADRESVAARLTRRLEAQQQLMRAGMQPLGAAAAAPAAATTGSNDILPSSSVAASVAPPQQQQPRAAATTVVRVCTGKKCTQGGAAAVETLAAQPGVVVSPSKCLKQCKKCVAVEMLTSGCGGGTLYTGVNPANSAGVLAMHRSRVPPAPVAPALP